MKLILQKLIHPLQGAFVPERDIQDNILLAHEIFPSFRSKKGKGGWIAIKLDMENAYDRLEWNFIFTILEKFSFNEKWVGWIKKCITTTSFFALVNNIPGE